MPEFHMEIAQGASYFNLTRLFILLLVLCLFFIFPEKIFFLKRKARDLHVYHCVKAPYTT